MEPAQGLLTFAEIAVAFAGFSSLVVLFRRDASGRWRRIDALAFRDMIGISLVAAAFSVFPFLVLQFSPQPAVVWGSLSALLALCMLGAILILAPSVLRAVTSRSEGAIAVSGFAGTAVALVLLGLNALGIGFERTPGPYVGALVWLLVIAGLMFSRLVVIPTDQIRE